MDKEKFEEIISKLEEIKESQEEFSNNLRENILPKEKVLNTVKWSAFLILGILVISSWVLFCLTRSNNVDNTFWFHLINSFSLTAIFVAIIWGGIRLLSQE